MPFVQPVFSKRLGCHRPENDELCKIRGEFPRELLDYELLKIDGEGDVRHKIAKKHLLSLRYELTPFLCTAYAQLFPLVQSQSFINPKQHAKRHRLLSTIPCSNFAGSAGADQTSARRVAFGRDLVVGRCGGNAGGGATVVGAAEG